MLFYLILAEGFEEVEAITVVDILRRAGMNIQTVSLADTEMVKGAHGIEVKADVLMKDADFNSCVMMILPGGSEGTQNMMDSPRLCNLIMQFHTLERPLAAICAAPMVLAANGALQERKATIYPGMEAHLEEGGAVVTDAHVVFSADTITGRGPGSATDFALEIVAFFKGDFTANELASEFIHERRPGI